MASDPTGPDLPVEGNKDEAIIDSEKHPNISAKPTWRTFFRAPKPKRTPLPTSEASSDGYEEIKRRPEKWSMGVLNDKETDEVPGMSQVRGSKGQQWGCHADLPPPDRLHPPHVQCQTQ